MLVVTQNCSHLILICLHVLVGFQSKCRRACAHIISLPLQLALTGCLMEMPKIWMHHRKKNILSFWEVVHPGQGSAILLGQGGEIYTNHTVPVPEDAGKLPVWLLRWGPNPQKCKTKPTNEAFTNLFICWTFTDQLCLLTSYPIPNKVSGKTSVDFNGSSTKPLFFNICLTSSISFSSLKITATITAPRISA